MKLIAIAAFLAVAIAAPSSYKPEYKAPSYPTPSEITVTSQSDGRNLDGSSQFSYAQSDCTTREKSQVQKKIQGVTYDSMYGEVLGNYFKPTLTWMDLLGPCSTLTNI
ncbi:hypothetical protein GHT06_016356 [Daphnia sinensis]|uniref:Uncharacterized protein n=1 Tax=Daphnia sinensis TaxID=1820382 RepID=A0AAD5KNA3_9CRUS|nr:hypothetical protein GHT06_016356 [Daphnia sinensis]